MSETLRCLACACDDIIGVEIPGVYDGVLYWACPACDRLWHRWPTDHYLRGRAERFVSSTTPTL